MSLGPTEIGTAIKRSRLLTHNEEPVELATSWYHVSGLTVPRSRPATSSAWLVGDLYGARRRGRQRRSSGAGLPVTSSSAMSRPTVGARVMPECMRAT